MTIPCFPCLLLLLFPLSFLHHSRRHFLVQSVSVWKIPLRGLSEDCSPFRDGHERTGVSSEQ